MNWGKGITIGIILFMLFILSFVFRAFRHDTELVSEDYYEQEANFEQNKQEQYNYDHLGSHIEITKETTGICFDFPESIEPSAKGSIGFYRPDSKSMDRMFDLEIGSDHKQHLSYDNFFEGYYEVTVKWSDDSTAYLFKDEIQF